MWFIRLNQECVDQLWPSNSYITVAFCMTLEVFQKVEPELKSVVAEGCSCCTYFTSYSEVSLTYSANHMEVHKQMIIIE